MLVKGATGYHIKQEDYTVDGLILRGLEGLLHVSLQASCLDKTKLGMNSFVID